MADLHPVFADGRDYRCARCRDVLPEGVYVSHGERNGEVLWVRARNGDGTVIHECGKVPGG